MSFTEDYLKLRKKRLKGEQEAATEEELSTPRLLYQNKTLALNNSSADDIAPVKEKTDDRKWFEKGAFADGYQFGDISKTILGTGRDFSDNVNAAVVDATENLIDTTAYGVGIIGGLISDEFQDDVGKFIAKDLLKAEETGKKMSLLAPLNIVGEAVLGDETDENSLLGDKSEGLVQSGAHLAGSYALSMVGVPAWLTMGVNSFGSEIEQAYQNDATHLEAGVSGTVSAAAEILFEKFSSGIKILKGSTADEAATKWLADNISNKVVRTLAKLGMDVVGEGAEEVATEAVSAVGRKLTYADEREWKDILSSEDAWDAFVGGAVMGGVAGGGKIANSASQGRDYTTGLTANEEAVVNKVYEDRVAEAESNGKKLTDAEKNEIYDEVVTDLKRGGISTDTIEEVLGGDTYKSYQDTISNEDALLKEFEELGKKEHPTLADQTRYAELQAKVKELQTNSNRDALKTQLSDEVQQKLIREQNGKVKADAFLLESYNERARRGQAFEADIAKYDAKQQEVIKKAVDSGILNNTNRTHEFVDMVAKISADKGVLFDFTNNAKLKDSGFAIDGKQVNGYVNKDGITVNIDSAKSLNSVVGHEIAHVLEGTELYAEMQKALFEYAKSKNDYQGRYDTLKSLYEGVKDADVDAELTADLVGDYLFTDNDFIVNLSTKNRNIFQKIYDEIKYLWKVATAGSKEKRELEKVKRAFEQAYKEGGKAGTDTKYSLATVEKVEPTSNKWRRTLTTEEAKARFPKLWDVTADESEARNPTQISSTVKSYRKVYDYLKSEGFDGTILDASSGLGYGTRAGIEEYGFDVEDIEPYPDKSYNPKYRDYSALDKKYDAVISNAVLNVLPQDQRDALVIKMGEMLNDGGRIFINVRGKDVDTLASNKNNTNISPMEWFVDSTGSYQKGFTKPELVAYLQDALGDGFTVKPTNMFGAVSAIVTKDGGVKYSLSDSDGKKLTNEQSEYFKDSKMRDENGNLKVMYHGSQDAGFHEFDASMSDDDTSFFFVDRNDVAASYSGTTETYEAQTIRTAEDMNNFIESIGVEGYEVVENDGKFTLLYEGDRVADSNTAQGIYDEFRWYEGVGEGDANYKVYLNLTNPLVVDADGRNWNNISREFSQEVADRYNSLTAEEKAALTNLAEWGEYGVFKDEMLASAKGGSVLASADEDISVLASAYEKLGGANANLYDAFSIASDNFSAESIQEFAVKQMNTRDYAQRAKEQGYDGVIFKNIVDNGGYSNGSEGASTVAIAFESNQIKSVANEKPTGNADIRYSLSKDIEDAPSRIYDLQVEVAELRKSIKEFESTEEFKSQMSALSEAIANNDIETGVRMYAEWRQSSGYDDLLKQRDDLQNELDNLRGEVSENSTNREIEKERAAIAKSGLNEADYFRKQAVKEFGYTPYFYDAGYITPNGKMLNFSGEKGYHYGGRGQDHRAIGVIYANTEGTDALNRFVKDGNIRIMAESPGVDISTVAEPTKEQYATIRKFIYEYADKDFFNVDLTDENGRVVGSLQYENRINPTRILNDIKHYYSTGEIRQQSDVDRFRYSLSEDSEGRELSQSVKNRFANSKVVDENGSLKVVYHGTATGEFSVFDKSMASVEGDFGSGFYFTDNESDVSEHYEGGGPDFDNKVARRAEQIEAEEEIDYDEAEKRAHDELYKGGHKFEVYLNIENPAIVGETMLLTRESYLEQYDESDYDDYDDYIGDVEQLLADDIENIVWEVERNTGAYSTDGLANVLYEAYYEGGIGIEELKSKINDLYLEDENGNLIGNEVARQIIECLGYDGIVDPTVSGKWNMHIEDGTTHYIVFKPNQIKAVTNQNPTDNPDIHKSLSEVGESQKRYGNYNVYGKDVKLQTAPVQEQAAPVEIPKMESATQEAVPEMETVEDFAPITEDEANALQSENIDSLTDADAPPEMEAPYYGEAQDAAPVDPFDNRDIKEVGNRKVKAYMYENPEVKPFFQKEANLMLGELLNTTKGERWYTPVEGGVPGEYGAESYGVWGGTSRHTSPDIEYLLDTLGYTYAEIEKGLKAIIEDDGAENNACSKRIEFLLNDRLLNGYQDLAGYPIPADEEYINLLNEKQISEYSEEARKSFFDVADEYAPQEDIAPVAQSTAAPVKEAYEAIKPKRETSVEPRLKRVKESDDIAPTATYQTAKSGQVEGQRTMFPEGKTAEVYEAEPEVAKRKNRAWSKFKTNFLDKLSVFEDLSLKTKNRELMGKANYMLSAESRAQRMIGNGKEAEGVKSLNDIRAEVESTGKTKQFYEYLYHKHNIDRMSLETKAEPTIATLRGKFGRLKPEQVKAIAAKKITDKTTERTATTIREAKQYLNAIETKNKPVFGDSVTAEVSQEMVAKYEASNPKFKEYAKDVYDYMNYLRGQLVESGVISQETAHLWSQMYPHYVPIRRLGDTGLNINVPLDTGRTGVNAPIKRATGGNRDILPLFDTMALRTEQTYKAIAKNNFGVELKNTLGTTIESAETNLDEVMDSVDNHEELLQKGKDGKNPTFTVFENGQKVTFEITEDMYDALKPTSDGLRYTNKIANTVSNLHRGVLTEYNPTFMMTNAIKDVQDVLINSQHPAKTYANLPNAIMQMAKNGKWYTEYLENGGEQNTYFDGQTNTFTAEDEGIKKIIGMPLRAISKANNLIERAPRLAEYMASRKAGASVEVAMLDAARVTTNFAAGGDVTKFLNRNGATFLNASVQGAMQQVRNVREAKANGMKGWVQLATKVAIAGLPALLLNNLIWDDDEDYEELSDYVKENYYVIAKYGDGKFVRIPKGRTLAVIQNAFEQVSNAITGDDEVDLKRFLELAVSNLAPNNPIDNNIISPIVQVANNETWYGEDLVPTRLQDLPEAEQYDESTDAISKWLGEKLDYSPYKINYLLNQYSGGVGDMVLPMLTPEAESGDNSIIGNMVAPIKDKFTTDSTMKNQNVSDFYDTVDELTKNAKSCKATDEDVLKYKYMNAISAELGELYAEKREIQNSDLGDAEKYEAVREIQERINAIASESLASYDGVSVNDVYATVGDLQFRLTDEGEWTKITDKQLEKQEEVTKGLGIDPSTYWGNKDEYDFAYEYPEKYEFLRENGVTYQDYKDGSEEFKDAYTWASKNPEKFILSKSVASDVVEYRRYASELYDIKADKDEDGKSITGSRKEKVIDYVNSLDIDYGARLILFKNEYNADDTYNYEIIDYLNSREDISYAEMETILKELGFTVDSDGNIYW